MADDMTTDGSTPARARFVRRLQRVAGRGLLGAAGAAGLACSLAAVVVAAGTGADMGDFLVWFGAAVVVIAAIAVVSVRVGARRSIGVAHAFFRQQDRLMLAVAHELRSPLGRALVTIDEGLDGAESAEDALRRTVGHVEDVSELLTDLLEMARVMSGALDAPHEPINVDRVVADAAAVAPVGEATVELDLQPAIAYGSARLLRRAVANLIHNAARHGYRTGPGVITVRMDDGGVTVLDDGPGVTEERLVDIAFETPLVKRREGAGLGLHISGWVAEMHGGRLVLANRPEGGFSARIEMPLDTIRSAAALTDDGRET